ncbi:aminotransferase [Granulosicoccus antarcticus]|uniref:Aspartate aminotransferase n=1 Tax=Granulosicoccus antarcticus IMCC3135 TaxID=1192854 RepID=A0A2Z2NUD4_9GAMM|nr:aminotransferase [Granulosicoccus antarcticus]ASJ74919.1 Aspartate aminotransferase [Granulosicoccus antarcticus IMCC3135]
MSRQLFNPNIMNLGVPPIPHVQRAARAYDKSLGPLIDLSQAVPDYPPPASLLEALSTKAGDPAWLGYGEIEGEPVLRAAYARDLEQTHGSRLTADNVMITSGCNQAFMTAIMSIAAPGESVMLINPWYFNHQSTLSMLGINTAHVSVDASTGFLPDPDKLAAALTPDVRAIAIVSPNNPTGAAYPAELLHQIYQLCVKHDIWMILDETYQDFLPAEHGQAHDLFNENFDNHLIVLSSFSKSYCIPGHRLGVAVAGTEVLQQMVKIMDNLQICAPRAAQAALAKCMPELTNWRADNRDQINQRAATLISAMDKLPGWRIDAMGAYFAYVQHPWTNESSFDVAERLARELGVVTLPGEFFGPGQERYLRVAFANVVSEVIALLPERLSA